jgi:hypothetical protein
MNWIGATFKITRLCMKHVSLIIFAVLAALTHPSRVFASVEQTPLNPLADSSGLINWQNPNPSEVAYVGTRAGALFMLIAKAIRTGAEGDQKIAEAIEYKALVFIAVGRIFELSTKTGTAEGFDKRLLLLGERYSNIIQESKEINNTIFPPFVRGDVEAANEVWPLYEALAKKVLKSQ